MYTSVRDAGWSDSSAVRFGQVDNRLVEVWPRPGSQARERIRTKLDTTFVVEAATGSGKTTEPVNLAIVLLTGAS
jgi:hypothetical protein